MQSQGYAGKSCLLGRVTKNIGLGRVTRIVGRILIKESSQANRVDRWDLLRYLLGSQHLDAARLQRRSTVELIRIGCNTMACVTFLSVWRSARSTDSMPSLGKN